MSEDQSEYVGGLLLFRFMHRLYEEYVDLSVLWTSEEEEEEDRPTGHHRIASR